MGNVLREYVKNLVVEGISDHLRSRGLDPNRSTVIVDEKTGFATFLLYNTSGVLCGYQQYNPEGDKKINGHSKCGKFDRDLAKYFTFVGDEGRVKKLAVWGVDTIDPDEPLLFITEGVFDIVKVHNAGYPGIAVLCNNPQPLKAWFKALGKTTVALEDNDEAGSNLRKICDKHFTVPDPYKDLGDMPQNEATIFIESIIAQLRA